MGISGEWKDRSRRRIAVVAASALAASAATALIPAPAHAAFPGRNGEIRLRVFDSSTSRSSYQAVDLSGTNVRLVPGPPANSFFLNSATSSADGRTVAWGEVNETSGIHETIVERNGSPVGATRTCAGPVFTSADRVVHIHETDTPPFNPCAFERVQFPAPFLEEPFGNQTIDVRDYYGGDLAAAPDGGAYFFSHKSDVNDNEVDIVRMTASTGPTTIFADPTVPADDPGLCECFVFHRHVETRVADVSPDGNSLLVTQFIREWDECHGDDSSGDFCEERLPRVRNARSRWVVGEVSTSGGSVDSLPAFSTPLESGHDARLPLLPLAYSPDGEELLFNGRTFLPNGLPTSQSLVRAKRDGTDQQVIRVMDDPPANDPSSLAFNNVQWLPDLPRVRVTERPPSLTNSTSAVFRFAPLEGFEGSFKCKLDDAAGFTSCNDGVGPDGLRITNLSEGEHVLLVRFDEQGSGDAGQETEVRWTVDLTPPNVELTGGPPASSQETSATFSFRSDDAGAEFRCSVDGSPGFPCGSPHTESNFGPGGHSFAVTAVDEAGNESQPARADWSVDIAPPPVDGEIPEVEQSLECEAPNVARATFGVVVAIGITDCLVGSRTNPMRFTSAEPVQVNGIRIAPDEGTEVLISKGKANGTVETTGGSTLGLGELTWRVDDPITWDDLDHERVATVNKAFEMGSKAGAEAVKELEKERRTKGLKDVFGFGLVAAPKLEFSTENGGQTKLSVKLGIPNLLRAVPGKAPPGTEISETGIDVDGAFSVSNDRGLQWQGRLTIPEFWVGGKFKVKSASVAFDTLARQFDGTATFEFSDQVIPASLKNRVKAITMAITIARPGFPLKRLSVAGSVEDLDRHIGDGFFLQRAGLGIFAGQGVNGGTVAGLTGSVGVSFLPKLQFGAFAGEVLSIDGTGQITFPADIEEFDKAVRSSGFEIKGEAKLFNGSGGGVPLGNLGISSLNGVVSLNGTLDYTIFGHGFVGTVAPTSFVSLADLEYVIEASGQVTFGTISSRGDQIVSTRGLMACFKPPGFENAVGYGLVRTESGADSLVITAACDIAPLRVPKPTRSTGATATSRSVEVPTGARTLTASARAPAGGPAAVLSGPGGVRIESGEPGSTVSSDGVMVVRDAVGTSFAVDSPAAGTWTLTTDTPASISFGRDAPSARPNAKLSRPARDGSRRLSVRANDVPGQRLVVFEKGESGSRRIGTLPGDGGVLRLRPASGLGPKRSVDVLVERGGLIQERVTVARFLAPPLGRAGRPGLARNSRTIRWARAPGASAYAVSTSGRQVIAETTKAPRVRLPRQLGRGQRLKVVVIGLDSSGRTGSPRVANLRG